MTARANRLMQEGYVYHLTSHVLTIADKLRGRAKLKVTETGDGTWTVSDCHADNPLGGATLLGDDDAWCPGTNEWPLVS